MADAVTAIGATTPGRQALLLCCLVSGLSLLSALLFPPVGAAMPGRLIVLVAVAFLVSGLSYFALLPAPDT
ncbi:hypothetical protein [Haloarcula montana]|uniref:hypothetical protein n=1 Tax=Haloarcula montana TaxID=3111776 RepID=UPI002D78F320|nr:hypothetical protein [Haloarcula sp. GH36]